MVSRFHTDANLGAVFLMNLQHMIERILILTMSYYDWNYEYMI